MLKQAEGVLTIDQSERAPVQVRHDARQERTVIEARREERLERLPVERPLGEAMRLTPSIRNERQQRPAKGFHVLFCFSDAGDLIIQKVAADR